MDLRKDPESNTNPGNAGQKKVTIIMNLRCLIVLVCTCITVTGCEPKTRKVRVEYIDFLIGYLKSNSVDSSIIDASLFSQEMVKKKRSYPAYLKVLEELQDQVRSCDEITVSAIDEYLNDVGLYEETDIYRINFECDDVEKKRMYLYAGSSGIESILPMINDGRIISWLK